MRYARIATMCVALLCTLGFYISSAKAEEKLNYRNIAERIETNLNTAASLYEAGNAKDARTLVQNSYFHLFENLEGPIRINVSAKHSFSLESEFGAIRRLIKDKAPSSQVRKRIEAQVNAINATIPALEDGYKITASPSTQSPVNLEDISSSQGHTEPHWEVVVDDIIIEMRQALSAYKNNDKTAAVAAVKRAQFEGYKNSLLETAVRRNVSNTKDFEINNRFSDLISMMKDGKRQDLIRGSASILVDQLREVIIGLPLIGPAAEEAREVRQEASADDTDWQAVIRSILDEVTLAREEAEKGLNEDASARIQNVYFDIFEASRMEEKIGIRDANQKAQIEAHFSRIAALLRENADDSKTQRSVDQLEADLKTAASSLKADTSGFYSLFIYSLLIIVREGFEAMLIVSAVVAYLVKTGHNDKLPVIRNSVTVAIAASFVTAVLVEWIFQASAASQEILEGATMILAAVVLFSMSYWLISKAEADHWASYIREKVSASLSTGSLRALWFVSFLSVYREGAETVLFYKALGTGVDMSGYMSILAGFLVGCAALLVLYIAIKKGSAKLAIRPFFMITGSLLYVMSFVFIGKGVMELVEGKVVTPTIIDWLPEASMVGIYPYVESALPQFALILAALFALIVIKHNAKKVAQSNA